VPVYEHCTTHCSRAILALENELLVYLQTCEVQGQKFPIDNAEAAPKLNLVK